MKCISLWQPWATAVALLLKRNETRGYDTSIRGRIGIHAAKRWTKAERAFHAARRRARDPLPESMPLGAVVCTAVLAEVHASDWFGGLSDMEMMYGDYGPGRFGWILRDVVSLEAPIAWSGKQGWFDVPDELFPPAACALPPSQQARLWPFPVSAHTETPA